MSTPIEIAVTCHRCKAEYLPSHADYVTGKWRYCPECRETGEICFRSKTERNPAQEERAAA